jgi:hypothetical protein
LTIGDLKRITIVVNTPVFLAVAGKRNHSVSAADDAVAAARKIYECRDAAIFGVFAQSDNGILFFCSVLICIIGIVELRVRRRKRFDFAGEIFPQKYEILFRDG